MTFLGKTARVAAQVAIRAKIDGHVRLAQLAGLIYCKTAYVSVASQTLMAPVILTRALMVSTTTAHIAKGVIEIVHHAQILQANVRCVRMATCKMPKLLFVNVQKAPIREKIYV